MKRFIGLFFLLILTGAASVFAFDLNPFHYLGGLTDIGLWGILAFMVGWLLKVKVEAAQLKAAVANIKDAIDSVRMAVDGNSPGGSKVTLGEAVGIGEKSLTAILGTLRTLKPQWIPHWIDPASPTPAQNGKP